MSRDLHPAASAAANPNVVATTAAARRAFATLREAQILIAGGRAAGVNDLLAPMLDDPALRPEVHYLMGIAALVLGQPQIALQQASKAIDLQPGEPRYHFALGRAHKAIGELVDAEGAYRRALSLDPRFADAHVSLGIVLKARGDLHAACEHHEMAIAIDARHAAAIANLALTRAELAARETEDPASAAPGEDVLQAAAQAVALEPGRAVLHRNLGLLQLRAHRRAEALESFNRALGLDPSDAEACVRMGLCLKALGSEAKAVELFERWQALNPPNAPVMRLLASLLTRLGRADEGLAWSEQAAAIADDPWALLVQANAYQQCRRLEESIALARRALALAGGQREFYAVLMMGLCYASDDPQPLFDVASAYGAELARQARPAAAPKRVTSTGRLRVGYVSGDFVQHSVSYFMMGLLTHHDRSRFEIVCYHNRGFSDDVTQRIKALADKWVECEGMTDEQLCGQIAADRIDILIDLAGHTALARNAVFARRAAPVQLAYLGFPTVSGVREIDFRISDAVIDPGDMPALASERPLNLERTMFCYRPDAQPPIGPPPMRAAGHVTLGSFNNIAKLSDRTLQLWSAAMRAVPGSRLLLKSASMAEDGNRRSILEFMQGQGIDAGRIELVARIADKTAHLALYNRLDIALDPFPYNGATTTCEALWMGLPVVTRRGRSHASRMGASLLHAIGKSDWVADSDDAYVAQVLRLAGDVDALSDWRRGARDVLQASALMDEAGFARAFENALLSAAGLRT